MFELVSVLVTLTLTLLIVLGFNFKGVIRNCLGTHFQGVKESVSLLPRFWMCPSLGLHLHSGDRLHLHSEIVFKLICQKMTLTLVTVFKLQM